MVKVLTMFLLSNITQPEMATYGCYEINMWVSEFPSLSLVSGSVSPTFYPAGPDSSGPKSTFGYLHSVIMTLPVNTTPDRGMPPALTQSSLDTPRSGSLPTCQEGQVRTSQ